MYHKVRRLKSGDRVAIVAPASPFDSAQLMLGLEVIRSQKLEPILGENIRFLRSRGLHAAPVKDRLAELSWALEDKSISGIIAATGGLGSAQLLHYLPYDLVTATAKPFMGFSDITALNNGILSKVGMISFNGPSASIRIKNEEQKQSDTEALVDALELLMSGAPWGIKPFKRNKLLPRCVFPGRVEGHAVGGNLTTFACLLSTPFFPNVDGAILFLEDVDEGGYEVERTLDHLALAGIFDRVAGVIFGEFTRAPKKIDPGDLAIEEVISRFFANGPPCLFGLNFSHGESTAVIPIGTLTSLDAEKREVSFDSPFFD